MSDGLFFAIEGSDGSGKATQVEHLRKRLEQEGYPVVVFDFPRYGEKSAFFVEQYLNGAYGSHKEVGPYTPSYFYALDRYAAAPEIRQALSEGKIVLANRYVGSNMAHQGAKFERREERMGFFTWVDQLEYNNFNIPRPTKNIILSLPAEVAQQLVDKKDSRTYTDKKRDIHEEDIEHLELATQVFKDLVRLFPKDFDIIDCTKDGTLLSQSAVHEHIWERILPMLPKKPLSKKADPPVTQSQGGGTNKPSPVNKQNRFVTKNSNRSYSITKEGEQFLADAVTDTSGNVYAFTEKLSTSTIAAAMARLSRRADDMRITILDEFAEHQGKDEALLKRVITAYGDDSVQQLNGLHVVVENASNLLTKKLEWGRLASYLEQSTRYIYFDQPDEHGNYKYVTPRNLDAASAHAYESALNEIFDLYSEMVRKLTAYVRNNSTVPKTERDGAWKGATRAQACDVIRNVLPVATRSTVGIFASGQALESLVMHLMADELDEARDVGAAMLKQARKIMPVFLERADKPDKGGATMAYWAANKKATKALADEHLPQNHGADYDAVSLIDVWPKNELDLVPHMLFEHSSLPTQEIASLVDEMDYATKSTIFDAYIGERLNRRHKPGRAIEQAHYSWELVCDYGIFRDLQRHRMVDDLEWQPLTPRYGYEVPELVEEAGLSQQYERCFDISYELYSKLQAAGYELEAQYATLLGHRMRWKVMYNARAAFHIHELRTTPHGHPGYRKLVKEMHVKLAEVHPKLAKAMRFVNKDEDPELSRLAAERYTQFKLDQLKNNP